MRALRAIRAIRAIGAINQGNQGLSVQVQIQMGWKGAAGFKWVEKGLRVSNGLNRGCGSKWVAKKARGFQAQRPRHATCASK
eukprot:1999645-Prymnesium_polylepis.2